MCRLFGYRSNTRNEVHGALILERNSLRVQSREHKDGWGIAYYLGDEPEVARGLAPAYGDPEFERMSAQVASNAVLAHVRLASIGRVDLVNAHPFVHGRWAFAHNGTVRDFARHRAEMEARIDPALRGLVGGETDSERLFYLFLTALGRRGGLERATVADVAAALAEVTRAMAALSDRDDGEKPSSMNFLVTDGRLMVASRHRRTLFFSERKRLSAGPPDPPRPGTALERLVIASEKLEAEHHWHEVPEGGIVGVDGSLRFYAYRAGDLLSDPPPRSP